MLLKIIMREENMVVGIFMLLCASLIYFLTRFLFIGSVLDLNVFHVCSLMLSFASIHISYVSIFLNY
jgi:hypothetical protein